MSKEKISVIVPVFNGEKHLDRCVDSIMNQTYENLEIVLINDGSTDSTAQMCDRYAEIDRRVTVVHKENGGLSDARNVGVATATGEFLTFIDSDDFILPDYVEYLYSLIKKYHTDLAVCTHTVVCRNGRRIVYGDGSEFVVTGKEALKMILYHDRIDLSVWAKLYRRSLFDGIQYPYGKYFEDAGTTYLLFDRCDRIACGQTSKYEYILRPDSMISDRFTIKKLELTEMTDRMAAYITERYPDLAGAALRRRVYARFSTLNQMISESGYREEKREMLRFIRQNQKSILADPNTPKRDRIAIFLLRFGFPVYAAAWKLYLKIYKN